MYNLNSDKSTDRNQFLSINQQSLTSLLTFVDFAAGLTIGFIEIDREQERDWIVEWLIDSPRCQDIHFLVLTYNDSNLRFLLDEILKSLSQQDLQTTENLVLIIKGLEYSIGHTEYPPILQNLNFVRDAFVDAVPYPILFCLPSYQITSIAKFAPDFWAWKSGSFKFESLEQESIFIDILPVEYSETRKIPEQQNRIDLLEGLLIEYAASPLNRDLSVVVSILQQLGSFHQSRQEWVKAETFLIEALNTIEENSLVWIDKANIWIELADVYREQQKYIRSKELCEQVLDLDRDILTPQQLAEVNNILGLIYLDNQQGNIAENLENAIACFISVMEIYTHQYFPQAWAQTKNNLGKTYAKRIWGDRAENLELAIECYQVALKVITEKAFPQDWAQIQNNLGIVYYQRIRGDRAENLELAIECYQAALQVITETDFLRQWARITRNLGLAYQWRIRRNRLDNQKLAIECYKAALRVYNETDFPRQWAHIQINLAIAYERKIQRDRSESDDLVIEFYEEALKVYGETDFPQQWAQTQSLMGIAYSRKINGEKAENVKRAIECYQNALKIYTPDTFPREWKQTQNLLSAISIDSIS